MSISGLGTAGYPVTGCEAGKAGRNAAVWNFAVQTAETTQGAGGASTAVLHGADEGTGDITISAWADVVSGASISVYKTQDFDPANPTYKVKTWDNSGNVTEQMIDVSKVDPENCDTAEMYAYTVHLKESGKGSFEETVLKTAIAKAVKDAEQKSPGSWSFSEKTNWVKIVGGIIQSEYRYGDLKGYMEWNKFLGLLKKEDKYETFDSARAISEIIRHDDKESLSDEEPEQTAEQESETKTEIIVKSDGSRVLVTTMNVGGMETTMSLKISEPTDEQDDNLKQNSNHNALTDETDTVQ